MKTSRLTSSSAFTARFSLQSGAKFLACTVTFALLTAHAHAQAVWTSADDRNNYEGSGNYLPFWSYGKVVDDHGNVVHVGNWSAGVVPGVSGSLDAYLGAPADTLCDVRTTLNSLTLAPGGSLNVDTSAALTVTTTDIRQDGGITEGGYAGGFAGSYTNAGTFTKSAGTGTFTLAPTLVFVSLPGSTVAVNSGALQLSGNSSFDTVTFDPAAGTLIDLVAANGTNISQNTLTNGARGGTVRLSQGLMAGTQRHIDVPQPCTLAFTGNVFQWIGGNIGGYQQGAIFTNVGIVNLSGDATKETDAAFTNQALVIQSGAGQFNVGYYNSGGSFTNAAGATYDLQSDANVGQTGYAFNNLGLFKKSGGTGVSTLSVSFNNQGGAVEVDSGTLQMPLGDTYNNGSTSTGGTFNVAAGALLDLGNGAKFTGTYTGGGGGTVRISQGFLYGDGTTPTILNFPGAMLQWTGGIIGANQRANLFTNVGTINVTGTGTVETFAVFTNQGLFTQSGTSTFNIGEGNSGGSFTNAAGATYDLQSDANVGQTGYPFNNVGLFKKSGGTGTSTLSVSFNNQSGAVEVDSGTLQMPLGDTYNNGSTSTGGTFNVAAGALLDLGSSGTYTGTYTGSGGGTVRISQGILYSNSTTAAIFNFPGNLFQWTGGVIGANQRGHLFTNAGTLTLSGDNAKQSYAQVTNVGTMVQTGAGNFNIGEGNSGGSFTNDTKGTYDLQSDAAIGQSGYPLFNKGFFQKSAGTGVSKMTCALTNTGTISVYSGTLEFADRVNDVSSSALTEGVWNVYNGATLNFDGYTINTNQADVSLRGPNSNFPAFNSLSDNQGSFALTALRQFTTAGALSNEGTLSLDAGTTLHVAGDFTASGANGSLAVTLGGTATSGATSPGVVQVNGAAVLGGSLSLTFARSATLPAQGDTLTILAAGSPVSGSFANVASGSRLATTDGKGSFRVAYAGTNAVVLNDFLLPGQTDLPTATLTASVPAVTAGSGQEGDFMLTLSSAPTSDVVVAFTIKGTAVNGTDYVFLKATKKIKAGKTSKPIRVIPEGNLNGLSKKTVVLTLLPGAGYQVGTAGKVKVKIFAP